MTNLIKLALMTQMPNSVTSLQSDLKNLGIQKGDGVFVHSSMSALGPTVGGPRVVVEALLTSVGEAGLVGMPGFSTDAYFPDWVDREVLTEQQVLQIEAAVPGFDMQTSPALANGILAETFRTWPVTQRSDHPSVSVCLNGANAGDYLRDHSLAWATVESSPVGRLRARASMKILLIGVGWNRCTLLHCAETLAEHRRTKIRRVKTGGRDGHWIECPDVADDLGRLFPAVGAAFEATGAVTVGKIGQAECRVCDYVPLLDFARDWINAANRESGDLH